MAEPDKKEKILKQIRDLGQVILYLSALAGIFSCIGTFLAIVIPSPVPVVDPIINIIVGPTLTPVIIEVPIALETLPTYTLPPIYTPQPTYTFYPTYTLYPTYTEPPRPTEQPVPTATITPSIVLPFEDTFDLRRRDEWQVIAGNWRVVDGQLTADSDNTWAKILVGDVAWTNYVVEAEIIASDAKVEIIVRANNNGYMTFRITYGNSYWVLYSQGNEQIIATSTSGHSSFSGARHTYRLEANSDIYSISIDGNLLTQVQDGTFKNGRAGLAYFTSPYTALIEKFRVEELP
jgi:hypothetical protein